MTSRAEAASSAAPKARTPVEARPAVPPVAADITVQRCVPPAGVPAAASLRRWAVAAGASGALCLRIVDAVESQALNRQWRGRDKPTNVLSFPPLARAAPEAVVPGPAARLAEAVLGDIVLCAPVIAAEAAAQGKTARAHWAHMVVHGVLHLRGFDHERPHEARIMESEEVGILAELGIADPYDALSPPTDQEPMFK